MTTTELSMGLNTEARPSSRVIKPPGGGHTTLFGDADVKPNPPRPSYNQQNSSNMNACIITSDSNKSKNPVKVDEPSADTPKPQATAPAPPFTNSNSSDSAKDGGRGGRVPPGGFSSGGFW